jgi:hypothetical protein
MSSPPLAHVSLVCQIWFRKFSEPPNDVKGEMRARKKVQRVIGYQLTKHQVHPDPRRVLEK